MALFNGSEYNSSEFNAAEVVAVEATFSISYDVREHVTLSTPILFDVLLQRDWSILYDVYAVAEQSFPIIYDIKVPNPEIYKSFWISYDVAEHVSQSFAISYQVLTEQAFSIIFDVGDWATLAVPISFEVTGRAEQAFSIIYDVTALFQVQTSFSITYDVLGQLSRGLSIVPAEGHSESSGGAGLPDFQTTAWPPVKVCETDGVGLVQISPCSNEDTSKYAAGAVAFASSLYIVNNECASKMADRMLNLAPSDIKDSAWMSEHRHQVVLPSSYSLRNIDGDVEIILEKLPADMTNIADIEIWVSGVSRRGVRVPASQKVLYLKCGQEPFSIEEEYTGTTAQIAAQIILRSAIVTINTPETHLVGAVTKYSTQLPLADVTDLPNSGALVVDEEVITYSNKNSTNNTVYGVVRGAFGTVPADHLSTSIVKSVSQIGQLGSKLANIRGEALVNSSNSGVMALWKSLGTLLCILWTEFYDRANAFSLRMARMKYLKWWGRVLKTRLWTYLKWRKVGGDLIREYLAGDRFPTGSDRYIAISSDAYNSLHGSGVVVNDLAHGLIKVSNKEYMYIDFYGHKTCPIGQHQVFCDDDGVEYVIRVVERGVEYSVESTGPIAHRVGSEMEYIPTNLHAYSNDASLLESVVKEPQYLYRDRMRKMLGDKANFPSMRAMLDTLEAIVPGSKIDLWDPYSILDGDPRADERKYVTVDKEVGWLLGIRNRSELEVSTYLNLTLFTQGYWEWVWDNSTDDSRLLQVEGRYPFFIRTEKWWFDRELLYQMVHDMKSAGTTPNYAINTSVEVFRAHTACEPLHEGGADYESAAINYKDNWFRNPDLTEGVIFSAETRAADGVYQPRFFWLCSDPDSMTVGQMDASSFVDSTGATRYYDVSSMGARINNSTGGSVDFYQDVVKHPLTEDPFGESGHSYLAQFYVRFEGLDDQSADLAAVSAKCSGLLILLSGAVLDVSSSLKTNYLHLFNDWWMVSFAIPESLVPLLPCRIGLRVADGADIYVTGGWLKRGFTSVTKAVWDLALSAPIGVADMSTPAFEDVMPRSGVVRVEDTVANKFAYVKYLNVLPGVYLDPDPGTNAQKVSNYSIIYESDPGYDFPSDKNISLVMDYPKSITRSVGITYSVGRRPVEQSFGFSYSVLS